MTNTENGLTPPKESFTTNYVNTPTTQKWLCIVNPNAGASSKRKLQQQFITFLKLQPHLLVIQWEDKNNFKPVEDYIDKIIAINYNGKITNKQNEQSLFLPIYLETRFDKDIANSSEELK